MRENVELIKEINKLRRKIREYKYNDGNINHSPNASIADKNKNIKM
jgi:hypothetical protein